MKYKELTEIIIGCSFEVINELGAGFLESVYEKSLIMTLKYKGLSVKNQQPINVLFRNELVGEFSLICLWKIKLLLN